AKLIMDEKRAQRRFLMKQSSQEYYERFQKNLEEIRTRLLVAHKRVQELKAEYVRIKTEKTANYRLRLEEIKTEWRQAKAEWLMAYREWKSHINNPGFAYA